MSTGSTEPNNSQGHPAHKEILDLLPESLHPLIAPKLVEWDKRQQDKLQEVQAAYDPYKQFVDNKIDPQVIQQSLYLANHLQSNPADFVERAIANFDLKQYQHQQQQQNTDDLEDELVNYDGDDISKHPLFKQVMSQLETMQAKQQSWEQKQTQAQQEQQLEDYLDSLEEEHGEFDRLVVASLLANNVDGPTAVKQWQDTVNAAALKLTGVNPEQQNNGQQQQVPVVMGGSGTAGSGTPDERVDMSALSPGETQNLVIQMLEAAAKDSSSGNI